MRHSITSDHYNFLFSSDTKPVLAVDSGDEIVFHTRDAHNQTVPDGLDVQFPDIDLKDCNPVTGPVYVRDAEPTDILLVTIKEIKLDSKGFVPSRQDMGILKNMVSGNLARNIAVKDGIIHFSEEIKIPVRPMIGTIGVAPQKEIFSSCIGDHGGNMDNNDVKAGAKLYFPVFTKGALLSLGDVHASMGDGELTSGGIDINSEVLVQVTLIKDKQIARPVIETEDAVITTSSAIDFYEANKTVTLEMIDLLTRVLEIKPLEAYWLISITGDLKISQAFNAPIGLSLRLSFPKIGKLQNMDGIF